MKQETKYCHTCKVSKQKSTSNFYWDSTNNKFESQCKECRLLKQKIQKRKEYNKRNERQRYLKRKADGEFVGKWKEWRDKYPEKYKARYTLRNAVRLGKVQKGKCGVCGDSDTQAHHEDYSKPLEVMWLCEKHHKERHYPTLTTTKTDKQTEV